MSEDRVILHLSSVAQGHGELQRGWQLCKQMLAAGKRLVLEIRLETRSDAQNRLLHSRFRDVAQQCEWSGRKWDIDQWKRLMTAAWCRTRNEGVQIVPALDGQGFDVLYQRTSKLSRRDCADLSEYVMAWGTDQGVEWSLTSLGRDAVDPVSGEILQEQPT